MAQTDAVSLLPEPAATAGSDRRRKSLFAHAARFARKRKLGAFGVVLVLIVLAVAVVSPFVQRYDDNRQFQTRNPNFQAGASSGGASILEQLQQGKSEKDIAEFNIDRFEAPSAKHWMGTDQFGRDIYARVIVGARLAVLIGVGASAIAVGAGLLIGVISGYFGGAVDLLVQRFVDGLQAFPALVLLLLIVQVMEEPPLWLTIAGLGFLGWATSVRIVRSAVLSIAQQPYIEAAKSFGASSLRIMLQHIVPNVVAPLIIVFSISIGTYILAEASLSFLGFGPADKTTWGKMVNAGRNAVDLHPWEALFSGIAITLTVLGFNLAGDAIRDELDPRLRGR